MMNAGTLHTFTRILQVPIYSGCNRKSLVVMLLDAALAACSSEGSRTSHIAKLLRQKYWLETPAFRSRSSNPSFLRPTSRLVLMSVTTSERIIGSSFWTKDFVAFQIFGILAHPVLLIILWISLLDFPW